MRVSGLFACCLALVQTAAPRPTKPKRKAEKYAEKSMHLLRKQKTKEKSALQIQKSMHKKSLAVRAGSVRPRGLAVSIKKVCTCCRLPLLPRVKYVPKRGRRPLRGLQNQKKGAKKGRKNGLAGQNLRLSRSTRYRRPEGGGGVCGSGGCLVCTLFAGSG